MPKKDVSLVLGRALIDPEFAKRLETSPGDAVKDMGVTLTDNEKRSIASVTGSRLRAASEVILNNPVKPGGEAAIFDQEQQQQQTGARLAALEARLGLAATSMPFDQQDQQQVVNRLATLEGRLAVGGGTIVKPGGEAALFDQEQQQQQTGARLAALEARLGLKPAGTITNPGGGAALFDQEQQQQQTGARLAALEARLGLQPAVN
ncbi:MAG: Os1348 family NHLP clan protein, partial [Proteobacteria bacterium]|nr:Os1348 family NHLP clan protein [Pseudomonadota bacterium]